MLHYLVTFSLPIKHRPYNVMHIQYTVKFLQQIDGHRRLTDQSLSHHIYTTTSTSKNIQPLYTTSPSDR